MIWLKRDRCKREQEIVGELIEAGHDPVMLAAVALKLARAEEKQRPIEEVGEVRARRQNPAATADGAIGQTARLGDPTKEGKAQRFA